MPKYYLRVEAVNIANFVYDTHDISTIRGGSYLLLDAIESLRDAFESRLASISTAASQGLFWFEASVQDAELTCQILKRDVLMHLHQKTGGHATFLVAIQEDTPGDFGQVLERLEANIHRQQWRLPTVAIPEMAPTAKACCLDGWRPGVHEYPFKSEERISAATFFRRQKGIDFKQRFFSKILGGDRYMGQISTKDLGKLAIDPSKGILSGKIAFIHVDGNSFGRIRREYCQSDKNRTDFDTKIQDDFRKDFLKALLELSTTDPDFHTQGGDEEPALRLEVLLWGGDEMTLVVPAWQGLRVMRLFYEKARDLRFEDVPLSHRAVMIFCHHNACPGYLSHPPGFLIVKRAKLVTIMGYYAVYPHLLPIWEQHDSQHFHLEIFSFSVSTKN